MTGKLNDVARKMTFLKELQENYKEILQQVTETIEPNLDVWCFHEKLIKIFAS